jgi:hypothetical protein
MKRLAAALAAVLLTSAPALAKDHLVTLTMDGRPVDRVRGIALLHDGVVYADSIDLVKTFEGLVTFGGNSERIVIKNHIGTFTSGTHNAVVDGKRVVLPGAPFMRAGDLYVPLEFFIARIASARVRFAPGQADIRVNLNPLSAQR